jgi:hypothetical protein
LSPPMHFCNPISFQFHLRSCMIAYHS